MNERLQIVLMIRGAASMLKGEDRQQFEAAYAEICSAVNKYGDNGKTALALRGAELAAE